MQRPRLSPAFVPQGSFADRIKTLSNPEIGYYLVEYPGEASGEVEICADELRISDLWIQGMEWGDIVAEYWGKSEFPFSVSAEKPGAFVEELPAIEREKREKTR